MNFLPTVIAVFITTPLTACASEPTLVSLYDEVNSSVVGIFTIGREVVLDTENSSFDEVVSRWNGTGVIVNNQGNVITAAHLVQTADYLGVQFIDGSQTVAKVIASDPFQDLALLEVDELPEFVRPAALANSDNVRIGEQVVIIGTPYGFEHSLSGGYISGRHWIDSLNLDGRKVEYFQTDAAINDGTSGAPLFNLRGNVIGIATMIVSQSGGSEGLGFAVTSNTASRVLFETPSFWSGMTGVMIVDEIAAVLNVPQRTGYLIQNIAANSPADRMRIVAGKVPIAIGEVELLAGGDILLTIDGIEFSPANMQKIQELTTTLQEGDSVTVQVLRSGMILDLVGTL